MTRSKWKIPSVDTGYLKKKHNVISRNSVIVRKFIGLTFEVHNGKTYREITATEDMLGHKFGEFSFTRSKFVFKKNKLKK
jgi:ribosomal protein S19